MSNTKVFRHNPQVLRGAAEQLKTLQEDLEVARRIQNRLLPEPPRLAGYDLAVYYQPAGEVGGDFYDFLPMGTGSLAVAVADASGKGLAGALLMVEARAMLRAIVSMSRSPRDVLAQVNRVLVSDLDRGMFVSVFLAHLDPARHELTTANAGHMPMIVHRARTNEVETHAPPGLVLGAAKESMFEGAMGEGHLPLEPGDRCLLYTDGVTELMNPVQVEYGPERLESFVKLHGKMSSEQLLRALGDDLDYHRAGQNPSDDITIVAITRTA